MKTSGVREQCVGLAHTGTEAVRGMKQDAARWRG